MLMMGKRAMSVMSYCWSSAVSGLRLAQAGRGWGELQLIVLHYVWTFGMAFACLAPLQAVAYLLLAQVRRHPSLPDAFVAYFQGFTR